MSSPTIVQIDLDDVVHPVSADYVKDGLNHAKTIGARAVILRLNTPGGLVDSMREMVEAVLRRPFRLLHGSVPMAPAPPRPDSSFCFPAIWL